MTTPEPQRRADPDPTDPLTHPLRRRILRRLHRCSEPSGPREVQAALGEGLLQIAYHLKTLASYGTTREAGPAPGGDLMLYESAVAENAEVLALLGATEAEDEDRKAASSFLTTGRGAHPKENQADRPVSPSPVGGGPLCHLLRSAPTRFWAKKGRSRFGALPSGERSRPSGSSR
jgi:hypothetical protein